MHMQNGNWQKKPTQKPPETPIIKPPCQHYSSHCARQHYSGNGLHAGVPPIQLPVPLPAWMDTSSLFPRNWAILFGSLSFPMWSSAE